MKHGVKHGGWPAGCFCPIFVDANFSQEVFFAGIQCSRLKLFFVKFYQI